MEFDILITKRSLKSGKVKVNADTYFDAVEIALKKARQGEVSWNEESSVVQHDCEDLNPEAMPVS